jgi:hypothetical protein
MTDIGIIKNYIQVNSGNQGSLEELTPVITITQSSHQMWDVKCLEIILKKIAPKVIPDTMIDTRMISPLRDGCGTPLQM